MSSDPKKPFDAPPQQTPDLLQKELGGLDRRRRVPTFEELQVPRPPDAPTDPMRPAAARPSLDNAPTQQHAQLPPNLTPRAAPPAPAEQWHRVSSLPPESELPTNTLGVTMPRALEAATQPARAPVAAPPRAPMPAAAAPGPAPTAPMPAAAPRAAAPAQPMPPRTPMPGVQAPMAAQAMPPQARVAPGGIAPVPAQPMQAQRAAPSGIAPPAQPLQAQRAAPNGIAPPPAQPMQAQHAAPSGIAAPPAQQMPQAQRSAPSGIVSPPAQPMTPQAQRSSPSGIVSPPAQPIPPQPQRSSPSGIVSAPAQPMPPPAQRSSPSGIVSPPTAPQAQRSAPSGIVSPPAQPTPLQAQRSSPSGIVSPPQAQRPLEPAAQARPPERVAPPSPLEFAQARPMPQVTPSVPSQGAVMPEGQVARPPVGVRAHVPQVEVDEPEPRTVPSMPVQRPNFTPPPAPAARAPNELPREMLVTQPGLPGPFAARQMPVNQAIPQRPPSMPELPAVAPARASVPAMPAFEEPLVRTDDTVTAEPAALWRRSGAWLTDLLFVSVLVLGLLFVAMQVIAPKNVAPLKQLMAIALPGAGLGVMIAFVYTTLFAFLWQGRTPGRRLMGIHLVDTTGHAPGPMRALARAMLSLISFGLFLSGFWLALFDRHGQTLHDKLTRTFVVKLQDA